MITNIHKIKPNETKAGLRIFTPSGQMMDQPILQLPGLTQGESIRH